MTFFALSTAMQGGRSTSATAALSECSWRAISPQPVFFTH